eukprot:PhF_6_TR37150/c0_g1_i1/m.54684
MMELAHQWDLMYLEEKSSFQFCVYVVHVLSHEQNRKESFLPYDCVEELAPFLHKNPRSLYVFGGTDATSTAEVERIDVSNMNTIPDIRSLKWCPSYGIRDRSYAATVEVEGKVVVIGGYHRDHAFRTKNVLVQIPAAGEGNNTQGSNGMDWNMATSLSRSRSRASALVWYPHNHSHKKGIVKELIVIGGEEEALGTPCIEQIQVEDLLQGKVAWRKLDPLSEIGSKGGITGHFCVVVRNSMILLTGGIPRSPSGKLSPPTSSCWFITQERDSVDRLECAPAPCLNIARAYHTSVSIGNVVYVFGGIDKDNHVIGSVESLTFGEDRWREAHPPMPTPRHDCAVAVVGELIFVMGGATVVDAKKGSTVVEIFDIHKNVWCEGPSLQVPRWGLSGVAV